MIEACKAIIAVSGGTYIGTVFWVLGQTAQAAILCAGLTSAIIGIGLICGV